MKFNSLILIGKFSIPYGIKGWIKINSFSEKKENIFFYQPWYTKDSKKVKIINIKKWKKQYSSLIVQIENFNNRDEINFFKKKEIFIKSESLPELKNSYYWKDIINCKVLNKQNKYLGTVKKIIETGANDVLIVQYYTNKKLKIQCQEIFIPFIDKKIIKNVDIINKIIMVDWDTYYL